MGLADRDYMRERRRPAPDDGDGPAGPRSGWRTLGAVLMIAVLVILLLGTARAC